MTNEEQNIKLVSNLRENISKGNFDIMETLLTHDVIWHVDEIGAPWSGIHIGPQQVKNHFLIIQRLCVPIIFELTKFIPHENIVVTVGNFSFKFKHNNNIFISDFISKYEIKNGKVSKYRIFEDTNALAVGYYGK